MISRVRYKHAQCLQSRNEFSCNTTINRVPVNRGAPVNQIYYVKKNNDTTLSENIMNVFLLIFNLNSTYVLGHSGTRYTSIPESYQAYEYTPSEFLSFAILHGITECETLYPSLRTFVGPVGQEVTKLQLQLCNHEYCRLY